MSFVLGQTAYIGFWTVFTLFEPDLSRKQGASPHGVKGRRHSRQTRLVAKAFPAFTRHYCLSRLVRHLGPYRSVRRTRESLAAYLIRGTAFGSSFTPHILAEVQGETAPFRLSLLNHTPNIIAYCANNASEK